ncbi:MAG: hypothetical protein ACK2UB_00640, partial [Anaerolineales bacterium]
RRRVIIPPPPSMTLRLALCFLFHQPLGEHAERACRIGYRGVLDTLLNHPRLKYHLMLSGTLVDALCWFDPPFINSVRDGLQRGIFRLLGSTYAQSLLLACEETDNVRQINIHRDTLRKCFDAEPEGFWSPGSTWSPRLAPLLSGAGYRRLILEGGILRSAGAEAPHPYRLSGGGEELTVYWADSRLRGSVDFATWFHRPDVLPAVLDDWRKRPDSGRLFPVLVEDAAAFGLWGYDAGLDPRADAAGLDAVLDWLERREGVETAFLGEAPPPAGDLILEEDVHGRSLDRMLADPDAPDHEEGYASWKDFLDRTPRLRHFRMLHNAVRVRMAESVGVIAAAREGGAPQDTVQAGEGLFALAERAYCAHQDRFGRPGAGGRGDPSWEGIGAAIAVAEAAGLAAAPSTGSFQGLINDFTGDGGDEILLRKGNQAAILSPYGGRLLYWVDLSGGWLRVGNPLAVPVGTLLIEARPPDFAPLPDDWIPQETEELSAMRPEGGRRRLARLTGECPPGDHGALPIWPRPRSIALKPSRPARCRALNDHFSIDGGPEERPDPRLDFRLADGAATFLRFFGYRLHLAKRISLTAAGVRAIYRFRNIYTQPLSVRLRLVSELCPDYRTVLCSTGPAFESTAVGRRRSPGIRNLRTGSMLVSHVSRPETEPSVCRPGVLAWEVQQTVCIVVEPGATEEVVVRLNGYAGSESVT